MDKYTKEAIRLLKQHCYSKKEMAEIGTDSKKIKDSFAYIHAIVIDLLKTKNIRKKTKTASHG